jgi:hypothetical protein
VAWRIHWPEEKVRTWRRTTRRPRLAARSNSTVTRWTA